jgi:hypothetical protein
MSKLRNFIKLFDIYGNYFQLRINNQTKFKTCSGGLLSIVTLVILIFRILSYGSDFFNRESPKISIEEGLFQSKSPLVNGTEYPIKPMMLVIVKYITDVAKPTFTARLNGSYVIKYLDECKPEYMDTYFPEYNYTFLSSSTSSYCFNLNDNTMGFDGVQAIGLSECSTIDKATLDSFTGRNITCKTNITSPIPIANVNLYTKQLGFNPQLRQPFINKTIVYNFGFFSNYVTTTNIFCNLQYLQDDRGWIIDNVVSITDLAPQQEIVHIQPSNQVKNIPYFTISLLINDKFKRYNRTYPKFQDFLATLGGFMKLILFVLQIVSHIMRSYQIDLYIIDEKFEPDPSKPVKEIVTSNKTKLENSQQSNIILI